MATKSPGDDEVTPKTGVDASERPEGGDVDTTADSSPDTAEATEASGEESHLTPEAKDAADEVRSPLKGRAARMERRRQRIRDEIERNRRGEFKIPTWVLTVALIAFIAAWAALIIWA